MLFKDFKNIQIENMIGVSPIGKDTLMLAKNAIKLEFTNALDIGTGTGFVPIYLKICGRNCDAVDINLTAIKCAEKNALNNQIKINVKISNLFDNVEKKYDLIIFNPPFGNMGSIKSSRYLEIIKSLIPKNN